jgi:hypothetical protein
VTRPVLSYPVARRSPPLASMTKADRARLAGLIAKARSRVDARIAEASTAAKRWAAERDALALLAPFSEDAHRAHCRADEQLHASTEELERATRQREALTAATVPMTDESMLRLWSALAEYFAKRKKRVRT